jgi:hypothetical protein
MEDIQMSFGQVPLQKCIDDLIQYLEEARMNWIYHLAPLPLGGSAA